MSFLEVQFPTGISFGSTAGISRKVDIVTLANGKEIRNSPWARSRRRYFAGTGVKTLRDIYDITALFECCHGNLYGFRWKDWGDFQSCPAGEQIDFRDQNFAIGDGVNKRFLLNKSYRIGEQISKREIYKPVEGTVRVGIDENELEIGKEFIIDTATGIVEFAYPPETGAPLFAGFEFDVPVRFDCDELTVNLASFEAGEIPDIPIVELME